MAVQQTTMTAPPPPDRRALPTNAEEWLRGYVGGLEKLRREYLGARQGVHLADLDRLQKAREAVAKRKNTPPEVLSLIDAALASTRRDAAAVEATLDAVTATPEFEHDGYVAAGVLATSAGRGPADATATLVILVPGAPSARPVSAKVGPDGSVCLVLSAAAAKQFADRSATIEIIIAGKPLAFETRVTVVPGRLDMVSLPVLPGSGADPGLQAGAPDAAQTELRVTSSTDEPEPSKPRTARGAVKRSKPQR